MSVLLEGKTREQKHWKRLAKKGGKALAGHGAVG